MTRRRPLRMHINADTALKARVIERLLPPFPRLDPVLEECPGVVVGPVALGVGTEALVMACDVKDQFADGGEGASDYGRGCKVGGRSPGCGIVESDVVFAVVDRAEPVSSQI